MTEPHKGQLFSKLYLDPAPELPDSAPFRTRLASYISSVICQKGDFREANELAERLSTELGYYVYRNSHAYPDFLTYFKELPLIRVLNSITVIYWFLALRILTMSNQQDRKKSWIIFVSRVFIEENLRYIVDESGGVHPKFDQEFEKNRQSSITALSSARYAAARQELERAYQFLSTIPESRTAAIRAAFAAVETLVKVMFPEKIARLEPPVMDRFIRPVVEQRYPEPGRTAAIRMLESAKGWITACQQYRHGAEIAEPVEPPLELTIHMVGTGAATARWLVDLNPQT